MSQASSFQDQNSTKYIPYRVDFKPNQAKRLLLGKGIRLKPEQLRGEHTLYLTEDQASQIEDSWVKKKSLGLKFNEAQVKHHSKGGSGIFSTIKKIGKRVIDVIKNPKMLFEERKGIPPAIRKFLQDTGNVPIRDISLVRVPVIPIITKVLNLLSLGQFNRVKEDLHYDKIWHNMLIVGLSSNETIRLEKNHVVEVKKNPSISDDARIFPIRLSRNDLTLNEMFANASKDSQYFWIYNSRRENCQMFTSEMLLKNGLIPDSQEGRDALKLQDGERLIKSLGVLRNVPKLLTGVAATGDRVINGDGRYVRTNQ